MCGEHVLGRHLTLVLLVVTRLFRQDLEIEAAPLSPSRNPLRRLGPTNSSVAGPVKISILMLGFPMSLKRFAVILPDSRPMVRLSDCTLVVPVPGTLVSM